MQFVINWFKPLLKRSRSLFHATRSGQDAPHYVYQTPEQRTGCQIQSTAVHVTSLILNSDYDCSLQNDIKYQRAAKRRKQGFDTAFKVRIYMRALMHAGWLLRSPKRNSATVEYNIQRVLGNNTIRAALHFNNLACSFNIKK